MFLSKRLACNQVSIRHLSSNFHLLRMAETERVWLIYNPNFVPIGDRYLSISRLGKKPAENYIIISTQSASLSVTENFFFYHTRSEVFGCMQGSVCSTQLQYVWHANSVAHFLQPHRLKLRKCNNNTIIDRLLLSNLSVCLSSPTISMPAHSPDSSYCMLPALII